MERKNDADGEIIKIKKLKPGSLREKETKLVSPIWKILHVSVFCGVAIASLVVSWHMCLIFKAFNYNCILYADFRLARIGHYYELDLVHRDKTHELIVVENKPTDIDDDNVTIAEPPKNNVTPVVRRRVKRQHIMMGHIVNKMETELKLTTEKSLCGFVMFMPMFSFVVGAVFSGLFMVCSRGGKGYQTDLMSHPQNLMYPVIALSSLFAILNIASYYHFRMGMMSFCVSFQTNSNSTGSDVARCTEAIDNITLYFEEPQQPLFYYYWVVNPSYYVAIVLWFAQIVVNLLRICFAPDYEGYIIRRKRHKDSTGDEEEDTTVTLTLPTYSSGEKQEDSSL